jgi:hypothetical protein
MNGVESTGYTLAPMTSGGKYHRLNELDSVPQRQELGTGRERHELGTGRQRHEPRTAG